MEYAFTEASQPTERRKSVRDLSAVELKSETEWKFKKAPSSLLFRSNFLKRTNGTFGTARFKV